MTQEKRDAKHKDRREARADMTPEERAAMYASHNEERRTKTANRTEQERVGKSWIRYDRWANRPAEEVAATSLKRKQKYDGLTEYERRDLALYNYHTRLERTAGFMEAERGSVGPARAGIPPQLQLAEGHKVN